VNDLVFFSLQGTKKAQNIRYKKNKKNQKQGVFHGLGCFSAILGFFLVR